MFVLTHSDKNKKNTTDKKIMPPFYFVILLLMCVILNFLIPIKKIIVPPYSFAGIILIAVGIILNLWCSLLFKQRTTTIRPHEIPTSIVTSGPFKISRNPIYLGMALILAGADLLLGSISTFITPVIFIVIINKLFIPWEEKNLEDNFGREYVDYKKRVRRWV